jgi:hypothetical protein
MEAILKISPSEFNENLFFQLKKMFEGKTVTIIITSETDETAYLTANPANHNHLIEGIANEPHITFSYKEFNDHVKKLLGRKESES